MPKYDPKKPVTIHNPYPSKKWPFRKGTKVYALYNGELIKGKVRWFRPKFKDNSSTYTLEYTEVRTVVVVTADVVRPQNNRGKSELLLIQSGWSVASAAEHIDRAWSWLRMYKMQIGEARDLVKNARF